MGCWSPHKAYTHTFPGFVLDGVRTVAISASSAQVALIKVHSAFTRTQVLDLSRTLKPVGSSGARTLRAVEDVMRPQKALLSQTPASVQLAPLMSF